MLLVLTPFTFLFSLFYFLVLCSIFYVSDFVIFWLLMEVLMLILLGVCFTVFSNSFSSLMIYFLVQTFSSFGLLVGVLQNISFFFTSFLTLKLGMFPLHGYFLSSLNRFPNYVLFICCTFHKVPVFVLLCVSSTMKLPISENLLWFSMVLSLVVGGLMMLSSPDVRLLLLISSFANSGWLVLSSLLGVKTFLFFFFFYSFSFFLVLLHLSNFTKLVFSKSLSFYFSVFLFSLMGLPPFPLFFSKVFLVYCVVHLENYSGYFILFLLGSCFVLVGYLKFIFSSLVFKWGSSISF